MTKHNTSSPTTPSRGTVFYLVISFIGAFWAVYYYNTVPDFADAYYHLNGAISLVQGGGFVDDYLWTYIGATDALPAPSHLYWMPGTSVIVAGGLGVFGVSYSAAQVGLALCLWGAMVLAYWLGWHYGNGARHAWMAGTLTLFAGFFTDTWGQTDTFAPYAFFGALALVLMARGITAEKHNALYWVLAGAFSAVGHLIRSDGLLLLLVGWSVLIWFFERTRYRQRLLWLIPFTLAYLVVMSPWFVRNMDAVGRILPVGGTMNAYFTEYNDLFNYPPDSTLDDLLAEGGSALIETRSRALFSVNGIPLQAIAYQGTIAFFPFVILALWRRRSEAFVRPFWIFAVGIHLAFALVFPEAGMRGGFWHATAALVPIWAVIGLLGLDDTISWVASFRRTWNPKLAQPILSGGFLLIVIALTVQVSERTITPDDSVALALREAIPAHARIMVNDPAKYHYFADFTGVTIPNETIDVALEIARRYDIDYLLLEDNFMTEPIQFDTLPDFLTPIEFDVTGARLYAFDRD
ncbi:MAG: ArnT family glycosyltransferase [Anaerolineae bacterium]